jgi:hypothetical protein
MQCHNTFLNDTAAASQMDLFGFSIERYQQLDLIP